MQILTLAPGAFLVIGLLFGILNIRKARRLRRQRAEHGYLVPQVASDFARKAAGGDAAAPAGLAPAQEGN
jgi:hypothetical protein